MPAAHLRQPDAAHVPERVTVPANPGAHVVHSVTKAAPALEPEVVMPKGHGEQPAAADVPALATVPKKAGAQTEH